MNATPSFGSSFPVSRPQVKHRNGQPLMSSRKFSERAQQATYRQFYAKRWQAFIHDNFESASHAAHVFKVDATTAKNWWEGLNAPQGWVVGWALKDPTLRESAITHIAAE